MHTLISMAMLASCYLSSQVKLTGAELDFKSLKVSIIDFSFEGINLYFSKEY